MSVFEKAVGFKSDRLSFKDMKSKVEEVMPDFEEKILQPLSQE